jgi:hypothetical protein
MGRGDPPGPSPATSVSCTEGDPRNVVTWAVARGLAKPLTVCTEVTVWLLSPPSGGWKPSVCCALLSGHVSFITLTPSCFSDGETEAGVVLCE